MSGKLDQSLDDILSSRPRGGRAVRRGRRAGTTGTKVAARAPTGGIQKSTRAAKPATKTTAPNGPAAGTGDSKIIVSNLVRHAETYEPSTQANVFSPRM